MSTNDNIQRLRDKRKSLEQSFSNSPKRNTSETMEIFPNPAPRSSTVNMLGAVTAIPSVPAGAVATSLVGSVTPTVNGNNERKSRTSNNSAAFSTTILEHVQFLEMKVKALEDMEGRLKGLEKMTKDSEIDKTPKYPTDSYSLIALNGPKPSFLWYELWSEQKCFYFWLFGMMVFLFQASLYFLLLFSETDMRWGTVALSGNPSAGFFANFIPPNTNEIVKAAQIVSLLVYVIFPDSTINDLLNAYKFFPRCACSNPDEEPLWSMRFACLLKGTQSLFGIVTTWLLVMTAESVFDIILSFTAVNFISGIDERAYSLAKDGVFGRFLKAETSERIGSTKLPESMQKEKGGFYCMILTLIGLLLFGFLIAVMTSQDSANDWITKSFTMEFNDEAFKNYSGCFELDEESIDFNRYTYNNRDVNASINYSAEERKWYLSNDASGVGNEIASSSETGSFDISASFTDIWTSGGGTPLGVQFTGDCTLMVTESNQMVDAALGIRHLGDGICDEDLNTATFDYDGGDCCAATCEGPRCGKKVLESAFGKENATVAGFPNCKDPERTARITIQLNDIGSSRRALDTSGLDAMGETPPGTFLALKCDEKTVLRVDVEEAMANNTETIMVEDGASCAVVVGNSAENSGDENSSTEFVAPDSSLYIDYTLFHGDIDSEKVMILNQHSGEKESVSFDLIPNCFFEELGSQIDTGSIYGAALSSSSKAIAWLLDDDAEVSPCGGEDFIERYTLAKMNFAMSESADFISREHHCEWPSVSCVEGKVDTISLGYEGLYGDIPSDIVALGNLKKLDLRFNEDISSLPDEIGLMSSLHVIDLDGNQLASVPTDIGLMTGLQELFLSYNAILSLPPEIGLMANLKELTLAGNELSLLPTEIGLLTNVEKLHLHGNKLSSIPTEIGLMSGLRILSLNGNQLVSVPTEIGLLTGLQELLLFDNGPLFSIPEEIRDLSSSYDVTLYGADVTCKDENLVPGEISAFCI